MSCSLDLMKKPMHISTTGEDPHSAFNQPKPPTVEPQRLPDATDDVSTLLLVQKAEIAKLAKQQDSLSRLLEQHTNSLSILMEQQKNDLCEIIDARLQDLPNRIFGQPDDAPSRNHSSSSLGRDNTTATLPPAGSNSANMPAQASQGLTKPEETPEPESNEPPVSNSILKQFVSSQFFEILMGSVIVLNIGTIFVQLEWKGYESSYKLGLGSSDAGYPSAEKFFDKLELVFNGIYLLELGLRLWHKRLRYFKSFMNAVDAVVVVVCCLQSFILEPAQLSLEASVVGIVRLFRLFRIIKIFRFMNTVEELRILLRTLSVSMSSLIWSMLLIGVIIIAAGVLMAHLTLSFIEDETADLKKREWVYLAYGTAARATYTMFEGAFTGVWTANAAPLLEDVSFGYGIFYVGYVVMINFAMIRVISALFLKQTMQVASSDAEKKAIEKMKERKQFMEEVRSFFDEQDTSGDGVLDSEEFEEMLQHAKVLELFATLQLSEGEARMLFDVLSGDEGVMDYREFLDGAMKLKSNTVAINAVQVLHEITVLQRRQDNLSEGISAVCSIIAPGTKWNPHAAPRRRQRHCSATYAEEEVKDPAEVCYLSY